MYNLVGHEGFQLGRGLNIRKISREEIRSLEIGKSHSGLERILDHQQL